MDEDGRTPVVIQLMQKVNPAHDQDVLYIKAGVFKVRIYMLYYPWIKAELTHTYLMEQTSFHSGSRSDADGTY